MESGGQTQLKKGSPEQGKEEDQEAKDPGPRQGGKSEGAGRRTPNPERGTWHLSLGWAEGKEAKVARFLSWEMNVLTADRTECLWKGRKRTSPLTCCLSPRPRYVTWRHSIVLAPATGWVPDPALAGGGHDRPAAGAGGRSSNACRPPWHPARVPPGLRSDWLPFRWRAEPVPVSFPWC